MIAGFSLLAQVPPTLPPPNAGSQGGPMGGGSAPSGSGIVLLIGMAVGYGARKVYNVREKLAE